MAQVRVNVYDMTSYNRLMHVFGIGIYHTGVEVFGKEYCFGGHPYNTTGIFVVEPRKPPYDCKFRVSLCMGVVDFSENDLACIIKNISEVYTGSSYNILKRNCNHFTNELCGIITNSSLPEWINRLADIGTSMEYIFSLKNHNPIPYKDSDIRFTYQESDASLKASPSVDGL